MQTKSGSTVKANYSYLSDGAKASVLNASGTGYDYNGTFTYSHASGGTRTLESVAFGGGRIRKNGSSYAVDYYVTDHLGSVRAIVNASGAIVEQNDFYPFGTRQQNGLTPLSANRWRFSGKEGYDGAFGIALDDFGARRYDRTAWTSIDPLAEKYYSISPYAYCAGNPVRFVDLEGEKIIIGSSLGQFFAKFGINNFENKVNADIENLKQIGKGNELGEIISRIEDSEQFTIAIKHARHNPRKNGNAYFMKYNTLYYDPDDSIDPMGRNRPACVGLAHEFGHADHDALGIKEYGQRKLANKGNREEQEKVKKDEKHSIDLENIVRRYYKIDERDYEYFYYLLSDGTITDKRP